MLCSFNSMLWIHSLVSYVKLDNNEVILSTPCYGFPLVSCTSSMFMFLSAFLCLRFQLHVMDSSSHSSTVVRSTSRASFNSMLWILPRWRPHQWLSLKVFQLHVMDSGVRLQSSRVCSPASRLSTPCYGFLFQHHLPVYLRFNNLTFNSMLWIRERDMV